MIHLDALLQDLDQLCKTTSNDTIAAIIDRINADLHFVRHEDDMRIIVEHILDSPVFQDVGKCLAALAFSTDLTQDRGLMYIRISVLFHFGTRLPNVFRRLAQNDWMSFLKEVLLLPDLGEVLDPIDVICNQNYADLGYVEVHISHIAVLLLEKLCLIHEMSLSELDEIDVPLLSHLCEMVESSRDTDETYNYAVIKLLICLNSQLAKKRGFTLTRNRFLDVLALRVNHSKTLTENLIFVFNRANSEELQLSITWLLISIFENEPTRYLFYTNDLTVILDIAMREIQRVHDDNEELQHALVSLLPLVANSGALEASRKQVYDILTLLKESKFVKPSTRRLAQRVLVGFSV
ncbi:hypothetical protein BSLG_000269 [Batrachochytrium salamandrivorans]|nr:hypothetical protein BSLG_000269 [Batrachochytrium salamandrivorans]